MQLGLRAQNILAVHIANILLSRKFDTSLAVLDAAAPHHYVCFGSLLATSANTSQNFDLVLEVKNQGAYALKVRRQHTKHWAPAA